MKRSIEQILQKLYAAQDPSLKVAPVGEDGQKGGGFQNWQWDSQHPGNKCKACQSDNPPPFCSCIQAWYGGVFLIISEDPNNVGVHYYNFDPNFIPPPGQKRAMEWPAGCPSLGQMIAPAFTSQAEWDAVKTSWITRIADGLIANESSAASILFNICHWAHGGAWFPCDNNWLQSAISQCVIERRAGLPCSGPLFDSLWADKFSGIPDVPYFAKFLMDNGCVGQEQSGSCCTYPDFGAPICTMVGGAGECQGVFTAGGNCSGPNPCGGLAPNQLQQNDQVTKQKEVMAAVMSILKVR